MSNLKVDVPLVNGDLYPLHEEGEGCSSFIETFVGEDLRPPARSLVFTIKTESGREVRIVIPNSDGMAVVQIDGEKL